MTNTKTIKIPVELELEPPALYEHDEDGERYGVESTFEMHIIDRAAEKLIDRLGDQAVRELREVVRQRAVAIVDRRIQEEVEETLTAGWRSFNRYGEPTGELTTLKSKVIERIETEDTVYQRSGPDKRVSRVDQIVETTIKEMIASELEKDIESIKAEATKKFRGAVDGVLVETIKGALKRELAL